MKFKIRDLPTHDLHDNSATYFLLLSSGLYMTVYGKIHGPSILSKRVQN